MYNSSFREASKLQTLAMEKSFIGEKMIAIHNQMCEEWPNLCRIAIAVYDPDTDLLKTFASSNSSDQTLRQYSARLSEVPSLNELSDARECRVINDLEQIANSDSRHTQWLIESGFKSSYTVPLFSGDQLNGFLFFDSEQRDYFTPTVTRSLSVYAELINTTLVREIGPIKTLRAAISAASQFAHKGDNNSAHLMRIAHYAHLLAMKVSAEKDIPDEFAEFIFKYAPLLDIGKIGIPDSILRKHTRLNSTEFETIKEHVAIGLRVVNSIISEFGLEELEHLEILRNIVGTHHEKYDGSGYPGGLTDQDIPLEGRITAVADVLDALTSGRPHKGCWDFDVGVNYIVDHAGTHFDPLCAQLLDQHREEFRDIHSRYADLDLAL